MSAALGSPVLLLNSNYQALQVVSARRAFTMLVKGVAEVIDVDGGQYLNYDFNSWTELSDYKIEFEENKYSWVKAVAHNIVVPHIIRLLNFSQFKRGRVRLTRKNIYARDRRTCQYCGKKTRTQNLNLDHVIPKSKGGKTSWENLVCSCVPCNTKKGNRTPKEAGMELMREPKKMMVQADLTVMKHDSWKNFVSEAYWNVELVD
jgi:5-methylcytosine-specific restriction endonuclease McrA